MTNTVAMILAGGQGSRLSILAEHRAKPAVPFGGIYRIIDFTMSNVMHSNLPVVGIMTQYKPYSLMDHISTGAVWGFSGRKRLAKILPPYVGAADSDWYAGTADAIYQNLSFIDRFAPELVLVLSGDHIYKMNYGGILAFHREKKADITIAMQEVPAAQARRFGVAVIDEGHRIIEFVEKSDSPPSNIASLGIYVFNRHFLEDILRHDAADKTSSHDFGRDIVPAVIKSARVYCYLFNGYWRDVGTLDAYWRAHKEVLDATSGLDLKRWHVRTNANLRNLKNLIPARFASQARIHNSIISQGCLIEGEVFDSVLSPGVHISPRARVENCVVMNNAEVGENASITHTILDKNTYIGKGCRIGVGELIANKASPHLLSSGLTVIGKNAHLPDGIVVGKNCIIYPDVDKDDYSADTVPSGETLRPVSAG